MSVMAPSRPHIRPDGHSLLNVPLCFTTGNSRSLVAFLSSKESRKIVMNTNKFEQIDGDSYR